MYRSTRFLWLVVVTSFFSLSTQKGCYPLTPKKIHTFSSCNVASALFPETAALINVSTLFKIEGTFLTPQDGYKTGWGVGGRSEKQGFALLMLESGEVDDMLRWIVGISDAFKVRRTLPLSTKS